MNTITTEVARFFNSTINPIPPFNPVQPLINGFARSYNETYATERNKVKDTPKKVARSVGYQSIGQAIKYHKVVWSDVIIWLQLIRWDW